MQTSPRRAEDHSSTTSWATCQQPGTSSRPSEAPPHPHLAGVGPTTTTTRHLGHLDRPGDLAELPQRLHAPHRGEGREGREGEAGGGVGSGSRPPHHQNNGRNLVAQAVSQSAVQGRLRWDFQIRPAHPRPEGDRVPEDIATCLAIFFSVVLKLRSNAVIRGALSTVKSCVDETFEWSTIDAAAVDQGFSRCSTSTPPSRPRDQRRVA